ncbi:MAG: hypothetical protein ACYTA5_12295 [Planctomycetota bacterium]
MTSGITKLAAAAVIIVAVLIGVSRFTGSGSGVAFADVIKPILNARTAIYNIIVGEEGKAPVIRDMVMGSRIRRTMEGMEDVSIIDLETMKILTLDEEKKKATYIDMKGLPKGLSNPLENLRNLIAKLQNSPHVVVEELDNQYLDGREMIVFHGKCPKGEVTIWAEPETALPVRIESLEGQAHIICTDFQFDVAMDDSLFSMEVPEGYTIHQRELDLFGSTEQDFIEGLRVFAEVFLDGEFPEDVSIEGHMKRAPMLQEKFDQMDLSDDKKLELEMKVSRYLLFIRFFKGKGKWHYAGKGVKLGDAETAIFWYRPKKSETWRVIYGDLSVKDVAAEDLPSSLNK